VPPTRGWPVEGLTVSGVRGHTGDGGVVSRWGTPSHRVPGWLTHWSVALPLHLSACRFTVPPAAPPEQNPETVG